VVLAKTADDVARVLAWCYERDVPLTPRGGGSGYAGGAVPDGGVVVALAGLRSVRSIEPLQWRAEIESGVTTHEVQRLARENGLYYPPDPGAAEQSQLGGNVATNAGGPHAFKYGVTGAWVTSLEVAIAPEPDELARTRPATTFARC
jgi:FAD/FMN-containing dehydrogenases